MSSSSSNSAENSASTSAKEAAGSEPHFKKEGKLAFISANGKDTLARIDIEIASSDAERQQGLMYRTHIEDGTGMLFIFDRPEDQSFWMKNTPTSLDIIFISPDRKILNYHEFTKPYTEQSYPSTGSANLVLEVVGGYCKKHNIQPGDYIDYTIIE